MKIYIDLKNLKALANCVHEKEIMKLVKENFDIYYTFEESEIKKEKRQKIKKIELWQKELSSGRNGKSIRYNQFLPSFKNKDGKISPKEELQTVFLVSDNNVIPKGILSCTLDDVFGTLRNLLINDRCKPARIYYTRPEKSEQIHGWEIISQNVSPCTDIIINDLYMFAQHDIEYENNSYKLLEELCKKSVGQCVNVVVVTKKTYRGCNNKPVDIRLESIINNLKKNIECITSVKPNITIIAQCDDPKLKRIHDRAIFTNYKLYLSGDSFKYYKEDAADEGKKIIFDSRGIWLGVCSLFDDEHCKIAERFIKDVQTIVDESVLNLNVLISGDRVSNFLNLENKSINICK